MKAGNIYLLIDGLLLAGILISGIMRNMDGRGIAGILFCMALLAGFYFLPPVVGKETD